MDERRTSDDEASDVGPWDEVILALLGDLLTWLLNTVRANPADPQAADALRRLAALRRKLYKRAGKEAPAIADPHGLLGNQSDKPEGK